MLSGGRAVCARTAADSILLSFAEQLSAKRRLRLQAAAPEARAPDAAQSTVHVYL